MTTRTTDARYVIEKAVRPLGRVQPRRVVASAREVELGRTTSGGRCGRAVSRVATPVPRGRKRSSQVVSTNGSNALNCWHSDGDESLNKRRIYMAANAFMK